CSWLTSESSRTQATVNSRRPVRPWWWSPRRQTVARTAPLSGTRLDRQAVADPHYSTTDNVREDLMYNNNRSSVTHATPRLRLLATAAALVLAATLAVLRRPAPSTAARPNAPATASLGS